MLDILVILQCAYATTEQRRTEIESRSMWLDGLWASHTGKRLKKILPSNCIVDVINSTTKIGRVSSAVFPPDIQYVKEYIDVSKPTVVLACGKVAQNCMRKIGYVFIESPHPAWRRLSNKQVLVIRKRIGKHIDTKRREK